MLSHARVAQFVKRHDKVLGDAQGFVIELTGYAIQGCQAEQEEADGTPGKWKLTDALATHVQKEARGLDTYLQSLRIYAHIADKGYVGKTGGTVKTAKGAVADDLEDTTKALDTATALHAAEFKEWDTFPDVISAHQCGRFTSMVADAKKAAANAWLKEQLGLYYLLRATARYEHTQLPDNRSSDVNDGTPYKRVTGT